MESYLIGILGIVFMMTAWVMIQRWWKTFFADEYAEEDALEGRRSCGNCGCQSTTCTRKRPKHIA